MCIFVAYYIAETNTINIFTNKTKTIMKYKLLRFSLLSVLVMLCISSLQQKRRLQLMKPKT